MDDTMRDVEDEPEQEPEMEPESPSNSSAVSESQNRANAQNPQVLLTEPSPVNNVDSASSISIRPLPLPEALTATSYDIIPTTASPHSTSVNAVTATADMRWVFSGGSDGYVRKFNWVDSINSKLMLTVAQRHPFVDSVVKAGVLMNYWENMDRKVLSPVYSLAAQSEGLWLLSGLESGTIRLQSVRHDEGKEIAVLKDHTSAVSSLSLTSDERTLISGSWDKRVLDWDLDTGKVRRTFVSSVSQISSIEMRPESSLPVPPETGEYQTPNGTFSSNYGAQEPPGSSFVKNESNHRESEGADQPAGSPADSLFEADSLFGDAEGGADADAPSGGAFAPEDDEFSQALPNGVGQRPQEHKRQDEAGSSTPKANGASQGVEVKPEPASQPTALTQNTPQTDTVASRGPESVSGLPHADDMEVSFTEKSTVTAESEPNVVADTTFLAASIDGAIRVWDRRQPDPVAKIVPINSPPWCMNACWSPDGNYIYAGRRNGVVEEYSLHKGLRSPVRSFRFPHGSGAVSALKAMPNGRHLIWYDILPVILSFSLIHMQYADRCFDVKE